MTPQALLAWGFLAIGLGFFDDIDATSELAQAFAWLIFIAVLFEYGPKVFGSFSSLTKGVTA